jgi:hypothetical protein
LVAGVDGEESDVGEEPEVGEEPDVGDEPDVSEEPDVPCELSAVLVALVPPLEVAESLVVLALATLVEGGAGVESGV